MALDPTILHHVFIIYSRRNCCPFVNWLKHPFKVIDSPTTGHDLGHIPSTSDRRNIGSYLMLSSHLLHRLQNVCFMKFLQQYGNNCTLLYQPWPPYILIGISYRSTKENKKQNSCSFVQQELCIVFSESSRHFKSIFLLVKYIIIINVRKKTNRLYKFIFEFRIF
jgi:hypothetical protein